MNMAKDKIIKIRISSLDYEKVFDQAYECNMTLSEYGRKCIINSWNASVDMKLKVDLMREISNISNVVNELCLLSGDKYVETCNELKRGIERLCLYLK